MNYIERIKLAEQKQREIRDILYWCNRMYQIEQYREQLELIGQCFKRKCDDGVTVYYKILDLQEANEFRCVVLQFDDSHSNPNVFDLWSDIEDCFNYPIVVSVMIRDILSYERITKEEFDEAIKNKYSSMKERNKEIINSKLLKMEKMEKECPLKDDTF